MSDQLVLLLLFLLFSVISSLFGKKRPPEQGEEGAPPPGYEEEPTFTRAPQPRRVEPAEDDPFADWGAWPGAEETAEEPVTLPAGWEREPEPVPAPVQVRPEPRREVAIPPPVRTPAPVAVERAPAEEAPVVRRGRWEQGVSAPQPVPMRTAPGREVERKKESRRVLEVIELTGGRREHVATPGLVRGLRDRTRLREAVLLSEVLGPPRSVRGWSGERRG